MSDEINHDGTLIAGSSELVTNNEKTLLEILTQNNWSITLTRTDGSLKVFSIINALGETFILNIYLGNIRYDASRASYEKKIQLGNKDPRVSKITNTDISKTYILGLYVKNAIDPFEESILAAWPILESVNYPGNVSLRIKSKQLQKAKIYGFSQEPNDTADLICAFRPEFIHFYLHNSTSLHKNKVDNIIFNNPSSVITPTIDPKIPRNKIIYGAPGTGKSYELRSQAKISFLEENTIRLTFHPNYSYQQFVGAYKPIPIYKTLSISEGLELYGTDKIDKLADQKEPLIDYTLVAGPFLIQLVNALKHRDQNYLLIIEEINRASVSAVFGDIFQLLDRTDSGESEYDIEFNKDITGYLKSKGIIDSKVKIPRNLYIWATMNSADQGVMPLDAAFKRRWSFQHIGINEKEVKVENKNIKFPEALYSWNLFRRDLNKKLKVNSIPEDKLIGPFFLNDSELADEDAIKNKLLMYLRDDVVRHNPASLFDNKLKTFSDIVEAYSLGQNVFSGLDPESWKKVVSETDSIKKDDSSDATITDSSNKDNSPDVATTDNSKNDDSDTETTDNSNKENSSDAATFDNSKKDDLSDAETTDKSGK